MDQGNVRNFKHYYRRRMLQKVLIKIDSNETMMATEVAHSLSVLDAINFMSASWNSVSAEMIQNCFFRGLTPVVPDGPFLGFSLFSEILANFTEEVMNNI